MKLVQWECAPSEPGTIADVVALDQFSLAWVPAVGATTAAAAWLAASRINDVRDRDFDADDWWFRCRFDCEAAPSQALLRFGGIATLADVWLNGTLIASSTNMFVAVEVEVGHYLRERANDLVVVCRALGPRLAQRMPRPRWKANFIDHQNLRWFRTSLLGRMPSWTSPAAPVGLWRPVEVSTPDTTEIRLHQKSIVARLADDGRGFVTFSGRLSAASGLHAVRLVCGNTRMDLELTAGADNDNFVHGTMPVDDVAPWFPTGYGAQPLYPTHLECVGDAGTIVIALPALGFRDLTVDLGAEPSISVNDVEVFARGVWWTNPDPVGLNATDAQLRNSLDQLVRAGVNIVAIPASTVYEDSRFYSLCDELGVMVWQHLMFTRLDYPWQDPQWRQSVETEIRGALRELNGHPSVVAVCGGFEMEQQVRMLGLDHDASAWLRNEVADLCASELPEVAYLADTPHGGTHPFSIRQGTSTYYGVGAYHRPLEDARRSGLRFATGCLAVSHVPNDEAIDALADVGSAVHSWGWKRSIPRDHKAAWDMEDTRDHYAHEFYRCDMAKLRREDVQQYLDIGRATTSRMVGASFAEWRQASSPCRAAIMLQGGDYVLGAGAGIIDANGRPKAVYYAMKRSLNSVALTFSDEGLNGVDAWVFNDSDGAVEASVSITAFTTDRCVATESIEIVVAARGHERFPVDDVLGSFQDLNYAFRFGPQAIVGLVGCLSIGGNVVARNQFRVGSALASDNRGLWAVGRRIDAQRFEIEVGARRHAHFVQIEGREFTADDQGYDIEPGGSLVVLGTGPRIPRVRVRALNATDSIAVRFDDD